MATSDGDEDLDAEIAAATKLLADRAAQAERARKRELLATLQAQVAAPASPSAASTTPRGVAHPGGSLRGVDESEVADPSATEGAARTSNVSLNKSLFDPNDDELKIVASVAIKFDSDNLEDSEASVTFEGDATTTYDAPIREVVDEYVDFIQSTDVGDLDNLDFLARTVSDMMDGLHLTKKGVGKVANMRQSAVGEVLSGKDFGLNWDKLTELCVLFHLIALAREPSTKVLEINGTSIEALASEKGNIRAVDLARRASGRMRRHTRGPCGSRGAAWAGGHSELTAVRCVVARRATICALPLYTSPVALARHVSFSAPVVQAQSCPSLLCLCAAGAVESTCPRGVCCADARTGVGRRVPR